MVGECRDCSIQGVHIFTFIQHLSTILSRPSGIYKYFLFIQHLFPHSPLYPSSHRLLPPSQLSTRIDQRSTFNLGVGVEKVDVIGIAVEGGLWTVDICLPFGCCLTIVSEERAV